MQAFIKWFLGLFRGNSGVETKPVATSPVLASKITGRSYPSLFQAWNPMDMGVNPLLDPIAMHDVVWMTPERWGMTWTTPTELGFDSVKVARNLLQQLREANPNMILLAELRHVDLPDDVLPKDSPLWLRDSAGSLVPGWGPYYKLKDSPEVRSFLSLRAKALCEVFDGIMLDVWDARQGDKLALLKAIRKEVGDAPVIIANINTNYKLPLSKDSAPMLNGLFIEAGALATPAQWENLRQCVLWAKASLRQPPLLCIETWGDNEQQARAVTALACLYDGYALYSPPNGVDPKGDHAHKWWPFWSRKLGKPIGGVIKGITKYARTFENGWVEFDPSQMNGTIELNEIQT